MLGIVVMIESARLSIDTVRNPGPGFVPFFLGLSMALLSIVSFLMPEGKARAEAFWNNWQKGKSIFYIFAGTFFYLILMRIMGFYIDTLWFLTYLISLSGGKDLKRSITISIVTMVVVYIVFGQLLIVPFPRGILGI